MNYITNPTYHRYHERKTTSISRIAETNNAFIEYLNCVPISLASCPVYFAPYGIQQFQSPRNPKLKAFPVIPPAFQKAIYPKYGRGSSNFNI